MKRHYFLQHRNSLFIYHLDLCQYDFKKNYVEILSSLIMCEDFNLDKFSETSNEVAYCSLVFMFSTLFGYNERNNEYKTLKMLCCSFIPYSLIKQTLIYFKDTYKFLGYSSSILKF